MGFSIAGVLFTSVATFLVIQIFQNSEQFAPGTVVDNIKIGKKTRLEAQQLLNDQIQQDETLVLQFGDLRWSTPSASLGYKRISDTALSQAFEVGRTGSIQEKLQAIQGKPAQFSSSYQWDEALLQQWIASIAQEINIGGRPAAISLKKSGEKESLQVERGIPTQSLDVETTRSAVETQRPPFAPIELQVHRTESVSEIGLKLAEQRAAAFVGKKIRYVAELNRFELNDQEIVDLIDLRGGWKEASISALIGEWEKKINRPPREPELEIKEEKVTKFVPPLDGQSLNRLETKQSVISSLDKLEFSSENITSSPLTIHFTKPKKALSNMNSLGITEKIGEAESWYHHSIPGRVHNVSLTASKINLTLIAPGETFSFGRTLGEVSRRTGFKPAYIISGGRTVLGDGGGVCQVSSTTFRLALSAGLPIVERKGHSYRVSYYEENALPGLDATVYGTSPDLKFTNDTGNHILIYTETFPEDYHMFMQMWGTSDGRRAQILDHKVWDITGPAPTKYQPDPNLPKGVRRQVDWSASGAKASFRYFVSRNGEALSDRVFTTIFQPWAAVYLVGTRE